MSQKDGRIYEMDRKPILNVYISRIKTYQNRSWRKNVRRMPWKIKQLVVEIFLHWLSRLLERHVEMPPKCIFMKSSTLIHHGSVIVHFFNSFTFPRPSHRNSRQLWWFFSAEFIKHHQFKGTSLVIFFPFTHKSSLGLP